MEAWRLFRSLNRVQRNTFVACFLGWALDALDFFLLTFVFAAVARDFGKTVPEVVFASHAHADDAADRRAPFRNAGRSLRSARAADDRHRFLFSDRIAHRVRAELHRVLDPARALRDWDGWRVGIGCITGDGDIAGEIARPFLRYFAAGLRFRLSAGSDRLCARLPAFRMAWTLYRWRHAGVAGDLHSRACSGIRGLGTTSGGDHSRRLRDLLRKPCANTGASFFTRFC